MPDLNPANEDPSTDRRIVEDLAAGRTISLSREEWSDPTLRERLPELLRKSQGDRPSTRLKVAGHEVLGEIGSGGMSAVYLARNLLLDRLVALKIVNCFAEGSARPRERMLREARVMASLSHPNIVRVFEVLDTGETLALAMEWVDGLTLAQLLTKLPRRETPDDVTRIAAELGGAANQAGDTSALRFMARVMRDVALAVEHVHKSGMLHLDIKPSNVLLRRDGTPLLSDFGVVRDIDLALTGTMSFAGTPIYAAPEQFQRKGARISAATDVYGLGITLYEALARSQPIEDTSLASLLKRLEAGRVPRLSERSTVPADLENIVHKAIEVDPARRYRSAAEFAADLTEFLAHRPVSARRPGRIERLRRWAATEPWQAGAIALAAAALPTIGTLAYVRARDYPKIVAVAEEARREAARELLHTAMRTLLTGSGAGTSSDEYLQQAYQLAPDLPVVLAAHAAATANANFETAAGLLSRHTNLVAKHRFLQLLQRRIGERRCAFLPSESAELANSTDPIDLTALCIDHVFWDKWRVEGLGTTDSIPLLERARTFSPRTSPLLLGMLAVLHASDGNTEQCELFLQSLLATQGDNPDSRLWELTARSLLGPEQRLAAAKTFAARFPDHPSACWELATAMLASEQYEEAERLLTTATLSRDQATIIRLMIADKLGNREEATKLGRALLASTTQRPATLVVRLIDVLPQDELKNTLERALAGDVVNPQMLFLLLHATETTGPNPALDAAVIKTLAARPPLHARIGVVSAWRPSAPQHRPIGDLIGSIEGLEHLTPGTLGHCARLLAISRRWHDAVAAGKRYLEGGRDDARYASNLGFVAIAAARIGDDATFQLAYDGHIKGRKAGGHFALFVENAERMLRPGEQHDPAHALRICKQLETMVERRGLQATPWLDVVRAEAEAATGNTAAAAERAEAARRVLVDLAEGRIERTPMDHWAAPDGLMSRVDKILGK